MKGLDKIINSYLDAPKHQKARYVDMFHPDVRAVEQEIFVDNPKFEYGYKDYSVSEMIYCFLVIEYPKKIAYLPKEKAMSIIDNLLQISSNKVDATAKDARLIKDMQAIEKN